MRAAQQRSDNNKNKTWGTQELVAPSEYMTLTALF